jgi:MFS family permease
VPLVGAPIGRTPEGLPAAGDTSTVAISVSAPLADAEHRTQLLRATIASTVGTTIEWYDFLLYTVVTGLVFDKLFFPKSDPLVGVLEAFAVYTVGFVARPIGAAIFGHFGDRIDPLLELVSAPSRHEIGRF